MTEQQLTTTRWLIDRKLCRIRRNYCGDDGIGGVKRWAISSTWGITSAEANKLVKSLKSVRATVIFFFFSMTFIFDEWDGRACRFSQHDQSPHASDRAREDQKLGRSKRLFDTEREERGDCAHYCTYCTVKWPANQQQASNRWGEPKTGLPEETHRWS